MNKRFFLAALFLSFSMQSVVVGAAKLWTWQERHTIRQERRTQRLVLAPGEAEFIARLMYQNFTAPFIPAADVVRYAWTTLATGVKQVFEHNANYFKDMYE